MPRSGPSCCQKRKDALVCQAYPSPNAWHAGAAWLSTLNVSYGQNAKKEATTTADPIVGVAMQGATGYAGAELCRLIESHPHASLRLATSRQWAGQDFGEALPVFGPEAAVANIILQQPPFDIAALCQFRGIQVVFACLPHGQFASEAALWPAAGHQIVDLSGDFRLRDAAAYPVHDNSTHSVPIYRSEAAYDLGTWTAQGMWPILAVMQPQCFCAVRLQQRKAG